MWQPEVRTGQLTLPSFTSRRFGASRRRAAGALLIAGMANTACYRYVPTSLGTGDASGDVQVRITSDAAARLSKDLGAYSTEIDGQFARQSGDSVSVGVSIARQYRGATIETTTQLLSLGRSEVVEVRKREFSLSRTILLSAGTAVGFGLLAAAVVQLTDPNPQPDDHPTPPPAQSRIPSGYHIRVRIPLP